MSKLTNTPEENVHAGHRYRMKKRIDTHGISSLQDHELLEYMLYPIMPRRDTNPIAHELLNTFGRFDRVFDAQVNELQRIPGIGPDIARYLKAILECNRRYNISQVTADSNKRMRSSQDLAEYARPYFMNCSTECLYLMSLSNSNRVLDMSLINEGSVNQNVPDLRKLTQTALDHNASCAIVFHNHPDGNPQPSRMDINWTHDLESFLRRVGVILLDHIIIAGASYFSLATAAHQAFDAPVSESDVNALCSRFPSYETCTSYFTGKPEQE